MKYLNVKSCLNHIENITKVIERYEEQFMFLEMAITRVLELEGYMKGEGVDALINNYKEMHLPAIRASRAFMEGMKQSGQKIQSIILFFESAEDGAIHEEFYLSELPRGYDRFESYLDQNVAEVNALSNSISHIIQLDTLEIVEVSKSIDYARNHANETVAGLRKVDEEGKRITEQLKQEMEELENIITRVKEWTNRGGPYLNGVNLNEVKNFFSKKTLHENSEEVEKLLISLDNPIEYVKKFPLSFKEYMDNSIMKIFKNTPYEVIGNFMYQLPVSSYYTLVRTSVKKDNLNKNATTPEETNQDRSVWADAGAAFSADKEIINQAADNIHRKTQEVEKNRKVDFQKMFSTIMDFVPVLGNIKSAQEASNGEDLVTGENLSKADRIMAGGGIFLGGFSKLGGKTAKNLGEDIIKHAENGGKVSKQVERVEYGNHFTKVKRKKVLKSNVEYISPVGYKYRTDDKGRIVDVKGDLELGTAKRNKWDQVNSGGEYRKPNDEGGHLIAVVFKGSGELDNLVPMNKSLNRSDYKKLENEWKRALEEVPPEKVRVEIAPKYKEDSLRPEEFIVKYKIGDRRWRTSRLPNP